jgi:hypothetical protein
MVNKMSKNAVIKAVTDAELKTKVEKILTDIGMTPDEAVNLFTPKFYCIMGYLLMSKFLMTLQF